MTRKLDSSTFVAIGEGLTAGVGHFTLEQGVQRGSFPALLAQQLGVDFRQPLMESPGVGNVGPSPLPAVVPDLLQDAVREDFPGNARLANLSVPGFTVRDALTLRPRPPLVARDDAKQTLVNLVLGLPELTRKGAALRTQVERARELEPTLLLVALGYHEVLELVVEGYLHSGARMDLPEFATDLERLIGELTGPERTLVLATVPDPLDTAYFSTLEQAAAVLRTEVGFLSDQYGFATDNLISLPGLYELGYQLMARQPSKDLQPGAVLPGARATRIARAVEQMNRRVAEIGAAAGAVVYDLHGLWRRVAEEGVVVGERRLTSRYLDGFYLLNGVYPGRTGHAVIAADLIAVLNRELHATIPAVDTAAVMADDANALARLAPGGPYTSEYLRPRSLDDLPPMPPPDPSMLAVYPDVDMSKINIFPVQTTYPELDPTGSKDGCEPAKGIPAGGLSDPHLKRPLVLPEGLRQTLPINKDGSYFGDALRVVDFPDELPFLPGFPTFGGGGNTLFGGMLMTDSHLQGEVALKFTEPDEDGETRFEVSHGAGMRGDDGVLAGPVMFRMPSLLNIVLDAPGLLSSGQLNLNTGVVKDLRVNVIFLNTCILSLFGVNPDLPKIPIMFPGPPNAGSSWARFEQRADGKLDYTFAGNGFLPLGLGVGGEPTRLPLPFSTPDMVCASIPARGLTLHPHLHLTTRESLGPPVANPPKIPVNTVQEYTPFVRKTSFGDVFDLNIDELAGAATGRCHLMGRVKVQFGPRFRDTVGFGVQLLPPGGLMSPEPKPLPYLPPGTARGLAGFNEQLVYPSGVTYHQSDLSTTCDPYNMAFGAIDLKTGRVIGELLMRGFVVQQLFVNLIDVEPCTPADSFLYQGAAHFERGEHGQTVFRFNGEVFLPYPKGFKFPAPTPDGRPPYVVCAESRLDPFFRVHAMHGGEPTSGRLSGGEEEQVSSIGQRFSYGYSIPLSEEDGEPSFEYTNHDDGGTFTLATLSWLSATNSLGSDAAEDSADVLTFGGFGSWSKDSRLHQVSVHVSTAANAPYVGIQIDGGKTSNVNTKPENIMETLP